MQLVTRATLLVAVAHCSMLLALSMLMDTAAAVEVGSDGVTPLLPEPSPVGHPRDKAVPTAAPPSEGCFILGSRSFSIPFTVEANGTQPAEVHLFVAHGPGQAWQLLDRKSPGDPVKQFQFTAEADGEFWFATRTIDAQGRPHPESPIAAQLKVYVDTTKPSVVLDAEADVTGRVDAVLVIQDATPLKERQFRYATDHLTLWQTVDIEQLPPDGKLQFTPVDEWQQLSIQLVTTDTPGNQSVVTRLLRRPRLAEAQSRFAANARIDAVEVHPAPYRVGTGEGVDARTVADPVIQLDRHKQPPLPNLMRAHGYADTPVPARPRGNRIYPAATELPQQPAFGPPSVRGATIPPPSLPPPASPEQIGYGFTLNSPQQGVLESPPAEAQASPPRPTPARTPAEALRPLGEHSAVPQLTSSNPAAAAAVPSENRYRSDRSETDATVAADRPVESAIALGRTPIRYSDSERFSLEYELQAVGAQGVEAIELYGSVGGSGWELWGSDPDRVSPFDIETRDSGTFGFRIVVVGQNGLASPRPLPTELPDIVVVVDKQTPTVRISGVQYGEGDRTGSLVIRYQCEDEHLGSRPIAMSFSDGPQGPWTTIAAGLRNDGDYVWPADPQLPRQLYLRIDATDEAGNVGTHILDQPIDTQGLAPRARIRGFQPLSGNEPPASGEHTANRPGAAFK
jgi:hypothetical protein